MLQILAKEINSFLNSLIAYIVISVFLTGIGLIMWVFPETSVLDHGFADMGSFFTFSPYVFIFLIPAITMRCFAEEKRSGTLEILLTQPVTEMQVILGKYFSSLLLVILALAPTLVYYFTISQLANPVGNIDSAGVTGSYFGLTLLGAVFASIGLFSSSFTENQIVAFIVGVFLCFIFYSGFGSIAAIDVWGKYASEIEQLGLLYHYTAMGKGLVDSRNIIYLVGLAAGMILLTNLVLKSRRW